MTSTVVSLLQGNVPQTLKWDRDGRLAIFQRYLALTRKARNETQAGQQSVIVWPETASPFLIENDPAARAAIQDASEGSPTLVGSIRFDRDERPRNSLFAVTAAGEIAAVYDKWHLVPFGEFQPSWIPFGVQVVPGLGFAPGAGPQVLSVPGVPGFEPLICYEAVYSGELRTDRRPEWIVNITNDAWFGNSSGPRQHLAAARMRAVEEGLPLLRAANTGISAGFDARGHELGRLGLDTAGILAIRLPQPLPQTIYSRYGLLVPLVLSSLSILASMGLAIRARRWGRIS